MKYKKIGLGVGLGLVVLLAGYMVYDKTKPVTVAAVQPSLQTLEETVEETGSIGYEKTLKVYAERNGKVQKVLKALGDAVAFGEVLVQLEDSAAALKMADASAKISAAKAQLDGAKLGDYANQKDAMSLQISEAKRQKEVAARYLGEVQQLYNSGAMSEAELKAAKDQLALAESQVKSLELSYKQLAKGSPNYQKQLTQAQLDQALTYRDQLLLEQNQLKIASPLKGIVMEKWVEEAALIAAGTPVMTIGDPTQVKVDVDILADEIGNLTVGDDVRMTAAYLPGETISGKVTKLAPAAKETASSLGVLQKRLPVTIAVTSHQAALKPGLPIEVTIVKTVKQNALCLPASAILEDGTGFYVYANQAGVVELRRIKLGIQSGEWVEVIEGLKAEDLVIASPETDFQGGEKIIFKLSPQ